TRQPEIIKSMKPLRKKLQKCRDPDRANLVELQRARREQAATKSTKPGPPGSTNDGVVLGENDPRGAKRRRTDAVDAADDVFGPTLG
ncbi:hypothetical protein E4U55_000954, partial [Claviceps digitariae]